VRVNTMDGYGVYRLFNIVIIFAQKMIKVFTNLNC